MKSAPDARYDLPAPVPGSWHPAKIGAAWISGRESVRLCPMTTSRTVIVGGGLSGLYAAHLLDRRGEDFLLLEARDRLGGRILSEPFSDGDAAFDLGPSWFWPSFQPLMTGLMKDLGVEVFPQPTTGEALYETAPGRASRMPGYGTEPPSYRVEGGVARVVERLVSRLPSEAIRCSTALRRLERRSSGVYLETTDAAGEAHGFEADRVLLAAPPRLLARTLEFDPTLSEDVERRLVGLPTWMAGHAKLVAVYSEPVWRRRGLSGQAMSRVGPLAEIHDASPGNGGPFALFGFVGLSAAQRRAAGEELVEASVRQLDRLFGPGLHQPMRVRLKDWAEDPWTATVEDLDPPAGHPRYGLPAGIRELWDGRLFFGSTETVAHNGGYLEGALEAAVDADAALGRTECSSRR